MRKKRYFLTTFLLMLAPTLLTLLVNSIVDPFNHNRMFDLHLAKDKVSYPLNYRLYKLIEFRNSPRSNIVLGDSRSGNLKPEYFNRFGISDVYNFAYGGGTLSEVIDTFWYAAGVTKLDRVVMGIPFNIFNEAGSIHGNLVAEAQMLIENPSTYYLNEFILRASFMNINHKMTGQAPRNEKPPMDQDEFWARQLSADVIGIFYARYRYPDRLLLKLKDIAGYCRLHGIRLVLFIPPTHTSLQNKIREYGLTAQHEQYLNDLRSISEVVDFDYPNRITEDRSNFTDPFHSNGAIAEKVVQELVQNTSTFSRRYQPHTWAEMNLYH